jgi:hypothetical protein
MASHELRLINALGKAPLNLFVAPIGSSGRGKSTGISVAMDLLPVPEYLQAADGFRDGLPLGSGEGIAEAFMGEVPVKGENSRTVKRREQVRHNVLLLVDEGEAFAKWLERSGSTHGYTTLRSAWGGETIGQANARTETNRVINRGTYSLGLIMGFQPSTAQALLADTAAGTPQRFLWCAATDPNVPAELVDYPGPLADVLGYDELSGVTGLIPLPTRSTASWSGRTPHRCGGKSKPVHPWTRTGH